MWTITHPYYQPLDVFMREVTITRPSNASISAPHRSLISFLELLAQVLLQGSENLASRAASRSHGGGQYAEIIEATVHVLGVIQKSVEETLAQINLPLSAEQVCIITTSLGFLTQLLD